MLPPQTGRGTWSEDPRTTRTGRRAAGYERDGLGPLLVRLQRRAFAQLALAADDRFLDVGCATGAAVRAAADRVRLAVGVDLSPGMIRHARGHAGSSACARYALARADQLSFPASFFTAVLCTTVLHYLDDPDPAVAEMTRVLCPGGRLVVGDVQQGSLAAAGPSYGWPGLTVTHRWRTFTQLGSYTIVLAGPAS